MSIPAEKISSNWEVFKGYIVKYIKGDRKDQLLEFYNKHQVNYAFPFNLKTACLHYKPNTSKFIPTFWSGKLETDDWIVYPWERDDAKTIQDYLT